MCIIAERHDVHINRVRDMIRALNPTPTAVVVGNDMSAFQLMKAFREVGVSIPEDISIVGFDAIALDYFIPITSVRLSGLDIAKCAVNLLSDMINGTPASECRIVLPTHFVSSESSGPAPTR